MTKKMKLAVGMHINDGSTFNELASDDVRIVRTTKGDGDTAHTASSADIMAVIATAAAAHFNVGIKGQPIKTEEEAAQFLEIAKSLRRTASQLVAKARTIGDAE